MSACLVYMTFPSQTDAAEIARALISARLAACVNVIGSGTSFYEWEGEVHEDAEVFAVAKTTRAALPGLKALVVSRHGYDVPSLTVYDIVDGHAPFLDWVETQCAGGQSAS